MNAIFNHVIKLTLLMLGQNNIMGPWYNTEKGAKSLLRKSNKPKLRDTLQNNWPVLTNVPRPWQTWEDWGNVTAWRRPRRHDKWTAVNCEAGAAMQNTKEAKSQLPGETWQRQLHRSCTWPGSRLSTLQYTEKGDSEGTEVKCCTFKEWQTRSFGRQERRAERTYLGEEGEKGPVARGPAHHTNESRGHLEGNGAAYEFCLF